MYVFIAMLWSTCLHMQHTTQVLQNESEGLCSLDGDSPCTQMKPCVPLGQCVGCPCDVI